MLHTLTIAKTSVEANDAMYVELDVPSDLEETFRFQQGQYLTFAADIDGAEVRRSYSICNSVGGKLGVAIKRIEEGSFSSYAHKHFEAGAEVRVLPPDGQFTSELDSENEKDYLCIAAGSGITPIISIVQSILEREPKSRVTLLYGNRRSQDIIFRDRLLWLKNAYLTRLQWINVFSREEQAAPILNGRINNRKGAELNRALIDIGGTTHQNGVVQNRHLRMNINQVTPSSV